MTLSTRYLAKTQKAEQSPQKDLSKGALRFGVKSAFLVGWFGFDCF
jgi:hypothetical protein